MPQGRPWEYDAPVGSGPKLDEGRFQSWYHGMAKQYDLNPNPDDPRHFYDYRAAFQAGAKPDNTGHWPSKFKREGHPRLVIDGVDTRTGEPAAPWAQDAPVDAAPNFPGKEASFSQGKPESAWHSAWSSVRDAVFGTPEHQQARAEGLPVDPPPSEVYGGIAQAGLMLAGPGAASTVARGAAGPLRGAASWVMRNPKVSGAVADAAPDLIRGDLQGAAYNAVEGAILGAAAQGAGKIVKRVRGGGGLRDIVRSVVGEAQAAPISGEEALREAKRLLASGKTDEAKALLEAARTAPTPPTPARPSAPPVDRGRAAVAAHSDLMTFAKSIAKEDPKVGEKIWILLDDSGKPVRRLTPDQAGAAARKGQKTTWVKNLWSGSL